LYPHANVVSLVPIIFFLQIMVIPAPIFLGIWFLIQLFQGTFSIGAAEAAGVAWWAHIGGFAAGFFVAWALGMSGQTRPQVVVVREGTDRRFGQIRYPWDR
jgi:membrane associated rhomboid family serine protease